MAFDSSGTNQTSKPLIGIVVNNRDPLLLRRVQLKIEGLIETEDEESLPWFRPKTSGIGSRTDYGNWDPVPELNTTVMVELPDGDIRNGIYSAMPDTAVDASQKRLFGEDYPNTYGSCDSKGSIKRTNKHKGYEEELHHSGIYTQKDKDGNIHIHIPNNVIIHIGSNLLLQVDKNMFFKILGMCGIEALKELGIIGSNVGVETSGTFAVDSLATDITGGMNFGIASAVESVVPDAVKKDDERHQEMIELQKMIKVSGELAVETIQGQRQALLGTRTS